MKPATILVVEDDRSLREGLAMNFRMKGYRVLTASDGVDGARKVMEARPDLVVLDIMLPGQSGLEVLEQVRDANETLPVIILSARGKINDKIEGLGLGADDYVTKPFVLAELLARVEARLRRREVQRRAEPPLRFGKVKIEPSLRRVSVSDAEVALSAKEFSILLLLARAPGRAFSRAEILDRVWGWGHTGTPRTVDNYVRSIRKCIEGDPASPRHLVTVRQVGYRLDP